MLVGAVAVSALLMAAPAANAKTVTVGSPLTIAFTPTKFGPVLEAMQTQLPETGALVASPANGRIVSWKVSGASGGPLRLRVIRPAGGVSFTGVSTAFGTITGSGVLTFQVNLPVKAGDMIGIEPTVGTDMLGLNQGIQSAFYSFWQPPLQDGQTSAPQVAGAQGEWAFNAQIEPNCIVPDVRGKKLKQAKQSLKDANCATGKVKGKKGGKVKSQSPKPGTEGDPGTKVKLKLKG